MINKAELDLQDAITKYQNTPHTPGLVTATWQIIWDAWTNRIGSPKEPPTNFPASAKDLADHEKQGDKVIFIPQFFASDKGQYVLNSIFPRMRNFQFQDGKPIRTDYSREPNHHTGWRYVESNIDAPHRNTSVIDLMERFSAVGRQGMTPYEYIIASQESLLTTGEYFDSRGTLSRLLGSNTQGRKYLRAWFDADDGQFFTFLDFDPNKINPKYGGRSSYEIRRKE